MFRPYIFLSLIYSLALTFISRSSYKFQQASLMSRIFKQGENSRPKIFAQWPKNPLRFSTSFQKEPYRPSKINESVRAEQTLKKSLMLIVNINNFLTQRASFQQQYKKMQQQSQEFKMKLQFLTSQSGKQFSPLALQKQLKQYYLHIRKGGILLREAENFTFSNLPNYDQRITSMKMTRSFSEAQHELIEKIKNVQDKRKKLQQSLVMFEQSIEPSTILGNQTDLQTNLQSLVKEISEQKLVEIHYLMLYQLQQMKTSHYNYLTSHYNDRQSYSIYEAINDSLNLMQNQRKEMKKDRHQYKNVLKNLTYQNASIVIPESSQTFPVLLQNERVYQANLQLLARYNAQTNLIQYVNRRKKYTQQFQKFKSNISRWKQQNELSSYLYLRHQMLLQFLKRVSVQGNAGIIKAEKDQMKLAYYDCLNCEVPQKFNSIRLYRLRLINEIGSALEKEGLIMPERNQLLSISQVIKNEKEAFNQQSKFHKYLNFFIELEQVPKGEKVEFLYGKRNVVRSLKYELAQNKVSTRLAQNYKIDLQYCEAIVDHRETNDSKKYLEVIERNMKRRWRGIPIGLDSLLFFYTRDVQKSIDIEHQIKNKIAPKLREFAQIIERQMADLQNQAKGGKKQNPKKYFNLSLKDRHSFFFNFSSSISQYSPKILLNSENKYWDLAQLQLGQIFKKSKQRINEVYKKQFFTFRILYYLLRENNIKITNYTQLTSFYLQIAQKNLKIWDQGQLFMEILKQKLFIKILESRPQGSLQFKTEIQVMKKINFASILLYKSNDHIQMAGQVQIHPYMHYSIRLHRSGDILTNQIRQSNEIQIQEKCRMLLEKMKKSPLVVGTKADLSQVQLILQSLDKLNDLKKVSKMDKDEIFLTEAYICISTILDAKQNCNTNFNQSDSLMTRDRLDKKLYIQKTKGIYHQQIKAINNLAQRIFGIYKGQRLDIRQEIKIKNSECYQALQEIAKKLQEMSS